jgi:hypothetical protein
MTTPTTGFHVPPLWQSDPMRILLNFMQRDGSWSIHCLTRLQNSGEQNG